MHKLSSIIIFYRTFFFWSLGINILLTLFNPQVFAVIAAKLILVSFLWYYLSQINGKKLLKFYSSIGVSNFKLFATVFIIDAVISTLYLLIIKEFI